MRAAGMDWSADPQACDAAGKTRPVPVIPQRQLLGDPGKEPFRDSGALCAVARSSKRSTAEVDKYSAKPSDANVIKHVLECRFWPPSWMAFCTRPWS
jgi:hypothetical protein